MPPGVSGDGEKVYYVKPGGKLMETAVKSSGSSIQAGTSQMLFSIPRDSEYEVLAGGKFLVNQQVGQWAGPVVVMLNWDAVLGPKK